MGKKNIIFYLTIFMLIAAFTLTAPYLDFDLWARLIAGMGVVDGGHVLTQDFLSYTPVHTWYDHEWGSGVVFYLVLKYFGANGLMLLQDILLFLIFFVAFKVVKLKTKSAPYNIIFFAFFILAALDTLNHPIRCHMFSFLLFTVFIYILEKVRISGNKKLLIWLPFLTILWNNLHGGVVAGLGLIGMYMFGEILNRKPYMEYLITLVFSTISLVINPWGIDYIKFLLHATTMERPTIGEWQGLFSQLHKKYQMTFKTFLLGTILIELYNFSKNLKKTKITELYRKADKVKWIVLFTTAFMAIKHIKMLPFCAIAVACYCYDDIVPAFQKVNQKFIYILLIFVSLFTITTKVFEAPINFSIYPVTEIEFVKINNLKGNILVDFGLGSYTSYKLYPQCKIFMDGRYEEVYPDNLVVLNDKFYASKAGWDDILKEFPPDIILIQSNLPVYKLMQKRNDWKLIFNGNAFGVFIKADKYTGNYKLPSLEREYYKNTLFDTNIKFIR